MDLKKILEKSSFIDKLVDVNINQLKHEEDDDNYQVWKIEFDQKSYILKESKGNEQIIYESILSKLDINVPFLFEVIDFQEKTYLLMEYIEGNNLTRSNRQSLILALDALIEMQKKTWESESFNDFNFLYKEKVEHRKNRKKYLNNELLEKTYEDFLKFFENLPKALCHDDLLPFNVIISEEKAFLIDWEVGGILPYPVSLVRLIAHTEDAENSMFFMEKEDKAFAIDYYYDKLLKEKGITYDEWIKTLNYFIFYEYCEWVCVGNMFDNTDGIYFKKYLPLAIEQAEKIMNLIK